MGILSWFGIQGKERIKDATFFQETGRSMDDRAAAVIQDGVRGRVKHVAGENEHDLKKSSSDIEKYFDKLLKRHIEGKSGDVSGYGELLQYAIENGKSTPEKRLYYFVAGVAEGLISMKQVASFAGYINKGPWLEFFLDSTTIKPLNNNTNQELPRRFTQGEFYMMYRFFQQNPQNVHDFLFQKVHVHPAVKTRALKSLRSIHVMSEQERKELEAIANTRGKTLFGK